jgi:hypothetical protein
MDFPFLSSGDERATSRRTQRDDLSEQSFRDPRQAPRTNIPRRILYEFDFDLQMYVISNYNEDEFLIDIANFEMIWDPTENRYIRVEEQSPDRPWLERSVWDPNQQRDVIEHYQEDIFGQREKIFIFLINLRANL